MRTSAALLALALATAALAQNDENYGKKIKEFTTEPFFLNSLIDYLPTAKGVPTPNDFLGRIIGAPNVLTYSKQAADYFRALEKASSRIKVIRLGMSEEGREMVVAVISDPANLKRLDRLKEINGLLGDPRKIKDEAEAEALIKEGVPMYWATGSMHATETGPPEMLIELAYRLVADDSPRYETIRKNSVVMITPMLDVDGRERVVDLYRYRKANPTKAPIPTVYWGHYVAHDDNRDAMTMSLQLSKSMMKTWLDFHPTVMHDCHESVPYLYISTGTGPYNAWLDPITISEWQDMAYNEIQQLTGWGMPGVWTHNFYDGWSPSYGFYVANGHNAIGRFYETFSGGGADTGIRSAGNTTREWYRPNPPFPRVRWSIRNNVNMSQSALLLGMQKVASEKEKFLSNYYLKSKRSVAKAKSEGPAAWVFPSDDMKTEQQAMLLKVLQEQGCEVHRLNGEVTTKDGRFPAGSYVVRMDQPYSRMADMLLDTQYYKPTDPRSYDDTGWTLGLLFGVKTVRALDTAVLEQPMALQPAINPGSLIPAGTKLPRIALVHTWTSTQDEGWARIALDQLKVPYKYVSVHELRDTANLRSKYDVILFPQTGGTGQSIVSGRAMIGDPIPWKATAEYPNLGGPDSTDDIRGGIELDGIMNLKRFLDNGGLLIAIGNAARVPVEFGLAPGVSVVTPDLLNAPGGVYRLEKVENTSIVLNGYGDETAAYFNANSLPILTLGNAPQRNRGGNQANSGRASGRGSLTDPDVIQGRPPYTPKTLPGDVPEGGTFQTPQNPNRPRVLLRFAGADKLLMSGMIVEPSELEGRAAVVHVPSGKGNVLLFGINPFWRGQTVGSYNLVFNAIRNWDKL